MTPADIAASKRAGGPTRLYLSDCAAIAARRRRIKEVFDLIALSRIPIEGQQKGAKESLFAKFPVMLKIQGVPFKTVPR
jgi:hypothetical protein